MGSVHAWERIGAAIAHIAREYLKIPILRYVDDFFAPERRGSMAHAMQCFAELVRMLLGPGAIADGKLEYGSSLVVLGVHVEASSKGYRFQPSRCKVEKWTEQIDLALSSRRLSPSDADVLSGRLAWSCSRMFKRFGRAMIRPIYDQQTRYNGVVSKDLDRALRW